HGGGVQQTRRHLAAHSLAERQLSDRTIEERGKLEGIDKRVETRAPHRTRQLVDAREELDGVARRELIPELRPLTEHRPDREAERLAVAPRHEPRDRRVAAAWRQDAGENL